MRSEKPQNGLCSAGAIVVWRLVVKLLSWFSILVFSTALAAADGRPAAPEPLLATSPTVQSFRLSQGHLIELRGSVGRLKDLNLLLDTGSARTVIDRRIARTLHLEVNPTYLNLISGRVRGGTSLIPSIEIGPITAKAMPAWIMDLSRLSDETGPRIDAILGMDFLGEAGGIAIDYNSQEVTFYPRIAAAANAVTTHAAGVVGVT